ncbi:PAS domain-containing sensor histidine kinase [Alkaliphilus transvaalensis]|uniref:PAS domain-containing sensor histidine kinase n=1 Tax=Alkaliphilus transvaalensis TaxID=114628 RepID=UPI0006889D35|nr:PAS domain-containing sensor histidine kinase [Alkaliphilus transvaalensis]
MKNQYNYRSMVENSPDLIIRVDKHLQLLYTNKVVEKEFGVSKSNLIGKTLIELNSTADYFSKWVMAVKRVFDTCEELTFESLQPSPYGFKHFHIRLVPERNDEGDIESVLSIGRNITEIKEAESPQFKLFNASADLLCIFDSKGNFVNLNLAWERVLGFSLGEIFLKSLLELVYPQDIPLTKEMLKKCYDGHVLMDHEMRFRCKDGTYKWLSWNCTPLMDDGIVHAIVRDITKQKEMEEKLRQSEERYRFLVESSPDGWVVISRGKIKYANPAAAKLLKMENTVELFNRPIFDFIKEEEYRQVREACFPAKYQSTTLIEIELVDLEGSKINAEVAPINLPYGDNKTVICMIRDISARKKNDELQKAITENEKRLKEALEFDKLRTEFFSNISHEFKTPLNVILGTLQLILLYLKDHANKPMEKNIIKKINTMKQNCYRLLRLVNNLIDINRIDAGYYVINKENYDIVRIIRDITLSVKDYIENKDIKFIFETQINSLIIACDPDKIERILLNLLSNAIKHTTAGGSITVSIKKTADKVIVTVKDTGTGIPKEKLDIIFERFSQVDESLVRKNQGSGIGLALVKSLVEMHKGKVSVRSILNKGSEFIIELPIGEEDSWPILMEETTPYTNCNQVEKISIEFSDIYVEKSSG